ncbi:potassium channel family protein [Paenibacillus sp. S-38]|uniref:potassium channel family protein n=1 Tax=Paenibacillus sp. S-38 TaxID=3416710 RepID=UPI003CF34989
MPRTQISESEFSRKKLVLYGGSAALLLFLLFSDRVLGEWVSLHPVSAGVRCLAAILMLGASIRMITEFMDSMTNSQARLTHIFTASGLLLLIVVLGYSILFHQVYRIYGSASFSGETLTEGDFLYFSITTFTSTGYGDIFPHGALANAVASVEMLHGFFISSLLLATLVWKYIQQHREGNSRTESGAKAGAKGETPNPKKP